MLTSEVRNGLPVWIHRGRVVRTYTRPSLLRQKVVITRFEGFGALIEFLNSGDPNNGQIDIEQLIAREKLSSDRIVHQLNLFRQQTGGFGFRPLPTGHVPRDSEEVLKHWGTFCRLIIYDLAARVVPTDSACEISAEKLENLLWLLDETRAASLVPRIIKNLNLSGLDLRGLDFRNIKFDDCDFSRANCDGVDFAGAQFHDCHFYYAELRRASFKDARFFNNTEFDHAEIDGVDFTGSIFCLTGADRALESVQGKGFGQFIVGTYYNKAALPLVEQQAYGRLSTDGFVYDPNCQVGFYD